MTCASSAAVDDPSRGGSRAFPEQAMPGRKRAFTLMELLIVVAIIALLIGLVIVSMRTVRASASRSESLGALRQIMVAYNRYTEEHRGRLLPGYIDSTLFGSLRPFEELEVELPTGEVLPEEDSQSYVWRLAPYVDDAWQSFFADLNQGALSSFNADFGAAKYGPSALSPAYAGGISERPSYGLNSIFVGGDSWHGGSYIADLNPWENPDAKIAATRLSEVKNPSRLIVFAPTALASTDPDAVYEDPEAGFCELRPPYLEYDSNQGEWGLPQWMVGVGGLVGKTSIGEYTDRAGLPIDRNGADMMPIAHLDGSTVVEQFSKVSRDMRRWDPFEVSVRTTVDPTPP
jgi:prepilin-type N-terminal cleavage/methylation domain-containing protein